MRVRILRAVSALSCVLLIGFEVTVAAEPVPDRKFWLAIQLRLSLSARTAAKENAADLFPAISRRRNGCRPTSSRFRKRF